MKVFVVGSQTGYARFIKDCELVDKQENADLKSQLAEQAE